MSSSRLLDVLCGSHSTEGLLMAVCIFASSGTQLGLGEENGKIYPRSKPCVLGKDYLFDKHSKLLMDCSHTLRQASNVLFPFEHFERDLTGW